MKWDVQQLEEIDYVDEDVEQVRRRLFLQDHVHARKKGGFHLVLDPNQEELLPACYLVGVNTTIKIHL